MALRPCRGAEPRPRAGARPFSNYTTPGTGPHFVEAGIKAVKANIREYFK